MERICDATGKPYTGRGIVLQTTDGPMVVSPAGLHQLLEDAAGQPAPAADDQATADDQGAADTPPAE